MMPKDDWENVKVFCRSKTQLKNPVIFLGS